MNSVELLTDALGYLERLEQVFNDLASRSEHQVQRSAFLHYQEQVRQMTKQLTQDLDNVEDAETFTMSLDRW